MDTPVIELALEALRTENFTVWEASPDGKAPALTGPVAAVRIEKVDWEQLEATLAVILLCPEALGPARCQEEAMRAGEVLTCAGARCSQGRCSYDGLAKTFSVEVLAAFRGHIQEKEFVPETGASHTQEEQGRGNPALGHERINGRTMSSAESEKRGQSLST